MLNPGEKAQAEIETALSSYDSPNVSTDMIWVHPLEEMEAAPLALAVIEATAQMNGDVGLMKSVVNLASQLHRSKARHGEKGSPRPYIVHPLRNTLRLIRYGATNQALLMGAVLHDTVEDHPFELSALADVSTTDEQAARVACLAYISERFGHATSRIVEGMSNPLSMDNMASRDEFNKAYAEHVQEATKDPLVFACKVSDFIDNAVSLVKDEQSRRATSTARRAAKYLPVCTILEERLDAGVKNGSLPISAAAAEEIRKELAFGRQGLKEVVEGAS